MKLIVAFAALLAGCSSVQPVVRIVHVPKPITVIQTVQVPKELLVPCKVDTLPGKQTITNGELLAARNLDRGCAKLLNSRLEQIGRLK